MPDTLTGLSREVAELAQAKRRGEAVDPFVVEDLAARVEEFREGLPSGTTLDEDTRRRLLVTLARIEHPTAPADTDAALRLLGVVVDV